MPARRWQATVLGLLVDATGLLVGGPTVGATTCPEPEVQAAPLTVRPGQEVRVTGRWFIADCPSAGAPSGGEVGVQLVFVQGDEMEPLRAVDAADDFTFEVDVLVPDTASPGTAAVRAVITGPDPAATLTVTGAPIPISLSEEESYRVDESELLTWPVVGVGLLAALLVGYLLGRGRAR